MMHSKEDLYEGRFSFMQLNSPNDCAYSACYRDAYAEETPLFQEVLRLRAPYAACSPFSVFRALTSRELAHLILVVTAHNPIVQCL